MRVSSLSAVLRVSCGFFKAGVSEDSKANVCLAASQFELVASASSHNHISVFFQDDVGVVIKVKDGDGV